jgi:hypothetical protein
MTKWQLTKTQKNQCSIINCKKVSHTRFLLCFSCFVLAMEQSVPLWFIVQYPRASEVIAHRTKNCCYCLIYFFLCGFFTLKHPPFFFFSFSIHYNFSILCSSHCYRHDIESNEWFRLEIKKNSYTKNGYTQNRLMLERYNLRARQNKQWIVIVYREMKSQKILENFQNFFLIWSSLFLYVMKWTRKRKMKFMVTFNWNCAPIFNVHTTYVFSFFVPNRLDEIFVRGIDFEWN